MNLTRRAVLGTTASTVLPRYGFAQTPSIMIGAAALRSYRTGNGKTPSFSNAALTATFPDCFHCLGGNSS
jgi:hypothetical protein